MYILGIESSCDDTSVALIKADNNGFVVLSEKTASQIEIHKKYGGVVPEIAGRKHAEKILPTVESVLEGYDKPNVIAVTAGPGLMTGLLVGTEVAKTLSYLWNVPLVQTNHIEGHIYSVLLQNNNETNTTSPLPRGDHTATAVGEGFNNLQSPIFNLQSSIIHHKVNHEIKESTLENQSPNTNLQFPALCLIVSGGHTELILMKDHGVYEKIGGTRDDAAGECFDKVAKLLNLDYPGGPKISKHSETGDPAAIPFPRPMLNSKDLDMSFSGLKTAALYYLQDNPIPNPQSPAINNFCASFEQAIVDVLVSKTIKAAKKYSPKTIILAGGVSANKKLRETLQKNSPISNFQFPKTNYCMDNAAMIAVAGYYHAQKKDFTPWQKLEANPQWKIYPLNKISKKNK